jgi:hypothetical protein
LYNEGDSIDDIQSFLDGINNAPGDSKTDDKPLEHTVPKSTYNSIKQANPGGKIYKPSKY